MEVSKVQVNKIPSFSKNVDSLTNQLPNFNPVHRVPNEVWEMIINNVSWSKDLINLSKAVPACDKITYPTRVKWLFDQVLPLIVKELIYNKKDIYNCRLVCKRWLYAVDHFLENNVVQRPASGNDDVEISNKLDCHHENLERYFICKDICYQSRMTERQKERLLNEAINHPGNPIVGRCADIQYPQRNWPLETADENSVDIKYLKTFGSHIYFLQVGIREGRQINYLKRLVELFGLIDVPNLKKLELKEFSIYSGHRGAEEDCGTTAKELHDYFISLTEEQINRFPRNLETLIIQKQDQYCSLPLKRIIMDLFYSGSIKSLNVNIFTFLVNPNFANLANLSIWLVSDDAVQGLLRINSPIRRLRLRFTINAEVDAELVFVGVNRFQSTLKYLDLDLDQITNCDLSPLSVPINLKPFMKPGSLQLPNVKTLKLKCYFPPSLNFITDLRSLEYIYFDLTLDTEWTNFINSNFLENEPDKEVMDIKQYLDDVCGNGLDHMKWPKMYESKIWRNFKRLLILEIFIGHKHFNIDGKRGVKCNYFRNYYEMLEENKINIV